MPPIIRRNRGLVRKRALSRHHPQPPHYSIAPGISFRRFHRSLLLPLMPIALESFDLRGYDLVISSESGPAKGVIVPSSARHVCYCHSPMRYLWDLYPDHLYDFTTSRLKRALMAPMANYLRVWDFASAARVDEFIANSENVRRRIWKTYRREAQVVHPPVAVERFHHASADDYFLVLSELVAYKRIDAAVRVFTRLGLPLVVAGDGPELARLKRLAGPNVSFRGRVSDAEVEDLYARCRAFLMPGEEDFGITAVEALASGKPVIALGRGGALETVPAFGGILYPATGDEDLARAVAEFQAAESSFDPAALRAWACRFSHAEFERKIRAALGLGPAGADSAIPG